MTMKLNSTIVTLLLALQFVTAFTSFNQIARRATYLALSSEENLRQEAQQLLDRAQVLRASLPKEESRAVATTDQPPSRVQSKWAVQDATDDTVGYRLSLDIGREDGTWMDPRWGASGKRIECSLDIAFSEQEANSEEVAKMVKDNLSGKSSATWQLETAVAARLRNGFDSMKCDGGAYRIDDAGMKGQTVRFYINVDGTPERGSPNGDIFIPKGSLYFSIPCFNNVSQLSHKEGIVTVRQTGWHTGWRREESRIVGVFRATPIEKARRLDGF